RADPLGHFHDPRVALLLDRLGHRVRQRVGCRARDRLEAERPDAIELCFFEPVQQVGEIVFGLAGETDHEAAAHGDLGTDRAPLLQPFEHFGFVRGTLHRPQHFRAGVLERDVEVRRQEAFGHQRDYRVDVRVGVDVVQTHPGNLALGRAQLAQFAREVGHVRAYGMALPQPLLVPDVDAVGAGVLADDEQLARTCRDQLFGFPKHGVDSPTGKLPTQLRDDAEGAGVIAAFGNLQIAVVPRGELYPGLVRLRDQVDERPLGRWRGVVYRVDHLLVLVRARHCEHLREACADHVGFLTHAAGDDDPAVLGDRLADRFEALFLG